MAKVSNDRIRDLLRRSDNEQSNVEKGRILEDLACHLFEGIPGITLTSRNVLDALRAGEIDIAFLNEKDPRGLFFLDYFLLVECKNWSRPVGSGEVVLFDTKLEDRGLRDGVLLSAKGITGDAKRRTAAHSKVADALREGRRIVVLRREEIEQIEDADQLVNLLKRKLLTLHAKRTS